MKWNLRLTAANRGIWKASEMQRLLAEHGLVISAGKMSGLWSGDPASIKLSDLDVICAVLDCGVDELLVPEPDKVTLALVVEPQRRKADIGRGLQFDQLMVAELQQECDGLVLHVQAQRVDDQLWRSLVWTALEHRPRLHVHEGELQARHDAGRYDECGEAEPAHRHPGLAPQVAVDGDCREASARRHRPGPSPVADV